MSFGIAPFGMPNAGTPPNTLNSIIGSYRISRNRLEIDNPATGFVNLIFLSEQDRAAYQITDSTGATHTIPNRFVEGYKVGLNNQRRMLVFKNGSKLIQTEDYDFVEQGANFNIVFSENLEIDDVVEIQFMSRLNLESSYYHTQILGTGQAVISWPQITPNCGGSILLFGNGICHAYRKQYRVGQGTIRLNQPVSTPTRFEVYLLKEFSQGGQRNYLFDGAENMKLAELRNHTAATEFPYSP